LPSLEESPLQASRSINSFQVPDEFNVSNVQACCRPAVAIFFREAVVRVCGPLTLHARCALNPNRRRHPHLENKWLRLLLPIILPATILPPCSTSPLPAAICRKAPSLRASLLRSRRTWPSLTSASKPKAAWRCVNSQDPA